MKMALAILGLAALLNVAAFYGGIILGDLWVYLMERP